MFQFSNRGFEVGDVAGNAGEHPAIAKLQFADRQVHRERTAILAQADDLATDADDLLLPGLPIIAEVAVVLMTVRLWHEHLDVLADHLVRRVAEKPLRRRVHRLDCTKLVDRDDRVHRGVEDRARAGLAFEEALAPSSIARPVLTLWSPYPTSSELAVFRNPRPTVAGSRFRPGSHMRSYSRTGTNAWTLGHSRYFNVRRSQRYIGQKGNLMSAEKSCKSHAARETLKRHSVIPKKGSGAVISQRTQGSRAFKNPSRKKGSGAVISQRTQGSRAFREPQGVTIREQTPERPRSQKSRNKH